MDSLEMIKSDMIRTIGEIQNTANITKEFMYIDLPSCKYKKVAKHLLKMDLLLRYAKTQIIWYENILIAAHVLKLAQEEFEHILEIAQI
jgi:hypothetical protein